MIGEPQVLRRPRDVPLVSLERSDDDLALRLSLALEERARLVAATLVRRALDDLRRYRVHTDHVAVGRDQHALHDVPQLANVVALPVVRGKQLERVGGDRLLAHTEARTRGGEDVIDELR